MNFSHCIVVAFQKYLRDNALHGPISGCKLHVTAAGCGQIKITTDTSYYRFVEKFCYSFTHNRCKYIKAASL